LTFGEKKRTLEELEDLKAQEKVDQGVLNILEAINSHPDYYTTSSCEGRVQLIQMEKIGDKKDSNVLGKWHQGTNIKELTGALETWNGDGYLYLLTQSPIFHVRCRDLDSAVKLQQIGFDSGFRYSTLRSMKLSQGRPSTITVELLTSLRLDIPLAHQGLLYPSREYLDFLLERCNSVLGMCKQRLGNLEQELARLQDKD
jgi:tRNA wybutosine-synthesizing protein 3